MLHRLSRGLTTIELLVTVSVLVATTLVAAPIFSNLTSASTSMADTGKTRYIKTFVTEWNKVGATLSIDAPLPTDPTNQKSMVAKVDGVEVARIAVPASTTLSSYTGADGVTQYTATVPGVGTITGAPISTYTPPATFNSPGLATGLTAVGGNAQIALGWVPPTSTSIAPLASLDVLRSQLPAGPFLAVKNGLPATTTSWVDNTTNNPTNPPVNGTTYYYRIRSVGPTGLTSTTVYFPSAGVASVAPPYPPSNGMATSTPLMSSSVNLSWTTSPAQSTNPVTGYKVYRATSATGSYINVATLVGGNVGVWVDNAANDPYNTPVNGILYYYKLQAYGPGGTSTFTPYFSGGAQASGAPSPITNPIAVSGDAAVSLTWTAPATSYDAPVFSLTVARTMAEGDTCTSGTEPGCVWTTVATGLAGTAVAWTDNANTDPNNAPVNGKTYFYKVTSNGSRSQTATSAIFPLTGVIPYGLPAAPQGPASAAQTPGVNQSITLTWGAAQSTSTNPVNGYNILRSSTGVSGPWTQVAQVPDATATGWIDNATNNPSKTPTIGSTYYYIIQSYGPSGQTANTSIFPIGGLTLYGVPKLVTNLAAVATSGYEKSISISWASATSSAGYPLTGYHILRATSASGTYTQVMDLTNPLIAIWIDNPTNNADNPPVNGTTYYYKVESYSNISGLTAATSAFPQAGITPYGPPCAPTNGAANPTYAASQSITLTWTAAVCGSANPVSGYNILRSADNATWSQVGSVQGFATATWIDNVTNDPDNVPINGTTYYYKLQSYGPNAQTATSAPFSVTPVGPPVAPTPLDAVATQSAGQSVTITWTPAANTPAGPIASYNILRSTSINGPFDVVGNVTGASTGSWIDNPTTDPTSPLSAGVSYWYEVQSVGPTGLTSAATAAFPTAGVVPKAAPQAVTATSATLTPAIGQSITLTWTPSVNSSAYPVSGYNILRSTNYATGYVQIMTTSIIATSSWIDNPTNNVAYPPANGTTYYYIIQAYGPTGLITPTPYFPGLGITPAGAPGAPNTPTNASVTSNMARSIDLTWTAATNTAANPVAGYNILRSETGSSGAYSLVGSVTGAATTTWVDNATNNPSNTPVAGTTYYYKVQSYGPNQQTSASTAYFPAVGVTPVEVPSAVTNTAASATNNTSRSIDLTWTASSSTAATPISGYTISRATSSGGTYTDLVTLSGASTSSWTDNATNNPSSTPVNGTTYYYKIKTNGTTGLSASTSFFPSSGVTPYGPPAAPTATFTATATANTSQSVSLSWGAAPTSSTNPVSGYNILRSTTSGSGYSVIGTVSGQATTTWIDNPTNDPTNTVVNGTTYYYQIQSYGPNQQTATAAYFPTSGVVPVGPPATPTNPAAVATSGAAQSISLSWTASPSPASAPVTSYSIYRAQDSATNPYILVATLSGAATNSWIDNAANNPSNTPGAGITYWYEILATGTNGQTSALTAYFPTSGVTALGGPAAPTAPGATVTNATSQSVTLTWTAAVSSTSNPVSGYNVLRATYNASTCNGTTMTGCTYTQVNSSTITGPGTGTQSWIDNPTNDTSYTPANGTTYFYQVQSYGPSGLTSAPTAFFPGSGVTPIGAPAAPTAPLTATQTTGASRSITVGWTAASTSASNPVSGYYVYRAVYNASTCNGTTMTGCSWTSLVPAGISGQSTTSWIDNATNDAANTPVAGTTYYYQLKSYGPNAQMSSATASFPLTAGVTAVDTPAAATNVNAVPTASTTRSISLSWTAAATTTSNPVSGYNILRSTTSGGTYAQVGTVTGQATTSWIDNATNDPGNTPVNCTTYYYQVQSYGPSNLLNATAFFPSAGVIPVGPPPTVTSPSATVTNAASQSVTIAWTAATQTCGDVSGYNITRSTTSGGTYTQVGTVSGQATTSWIDNATNNPGSTPVNGQTYYYKIITYGPTGQTSAATSYFPASGVVPVGPPAIPTSPNATATTGASQSVTLTWTVPANTTANPVSGYAVYRATSSGGTYTQVGNVTGAATATWIDNAANDPSNTPVNGQTYWYQIQSYGTNSQYSSLTTAFPVAGVTPVGPPAAPTTPTTATVTNAAGRSVDLTWSTAPTSSTNPVSGYNILRSTTSGGTYTQVGTVTGQATTSWVDNATNDAGNTPVNGTTYYYEIQSYGPNGQTSAVTAYFPASGVTPIGAPGAVTSPNAVGTSGASQSVTLTWTIPSNTTANPVSNYVISRSTTSGGTYTDLVTITNLSTATWIDNATNDPSNTPVNGTTYYYKITTNGPNNQSAVTTYFPTSGVTPYGPPAAATAMAATASNASVALTWTAPTSSVPNPVNSLDVLRATASAGPYTAVKTGLAASATSWTDNAANNPGSTPVNGTTYYYQIRSNGNLSQSTTTAYFPNPSGITPYGGPALATNLAAAATTSASNSITLTWTAAVSTGSNPVNSYNILRSDTGSAGTYNQVATIASPTDTSWTDNATNNPSSTPVNGTTYYYKIVSVGNLSQTSTTAFFPSSGVVPYGAPAAPTPTNAVATTNASQSITVTWTAASTSTPNPVAGYNILRSTTSGSGYVQVGTVSGQSTVSWIDNAANDPSNTPVNGTTYYYQLQSYGPNALTSGITAYFPNPSGVMPYGPPAAATGGVATVTTAASQSVNLTWTAAATTTANPVSGYNILRSTTSGSGYSQVGTVSGQGTTSWVDNPTNDPGNTLVNGTTYYYKIQSYGTNNQTTDSAYFNNPSGITPIGAPAATTGFTTAAATTNTANSISLAWNAASSTTANPVTGYYIWRSTVATSGYTQVASTTSTSWIDNATNNPGNAPVNGTTYYYIVQTYGTNSQTSTPTITGGTPSPTSGTNFTSGITAVTFPVAPTPLDAVATTSASQSITVTWTAATTTASAPVTGYYIWRATTSGGTYTRVGSVSGQATASWIDNATNDPSNTPVNGTTYYYKLQSYNGSWDFNSTNSTTSFFPAAGTMAYGAPAATTGFTTAAATPSASASISLAWNAASATTANPVTGYYIWRSTTATSGYTKIATTSSTSWIDNATNNPTYPLTNGTTYYYIVQTYGTNTLTSTPTITTGTPSPTTGTNFTSGIVPVTAPATPGTPTVTQTSGAAQSLSLAWTTISSSASQPATGYNILRATYSGTCGAYTQVNNATVALATGTYVDNSTNSTSAPTAGTQYCYQVQAIGQGGFTTNSGTGGPVTSITNPDITTSASAAVTNAASASISLTWTAVSTNLTAAPVTGYYIWRSTAATSGYTQVGSTTSTSWIDNATNDPSNPLTNGTAYYYVIQTYGPSGLRSAPTFTTGTPSPTTGTNFTGSAIPVGAPAITASSAAVTTPGTVGSVKVTWSAVSSTTANPVAGYYVWRSTSAASGYSNIYTSVGAGSGTITWYDTTGTNGTNYYYVIQTYGTTALTSNPTFTTGTPSPTTGTNFAGPAAPVTNPAQPGTPTVTQTSNVAQSLSLAWTTISSSASQPATGYNILRATYSGTCGAYTQVNNATVALATGTYVDNSTNSTSAPTAGVQYCYQVQAAGTYGLTTNSGSGGPATSITNPAAITGYSSSSPYATVNTGQSITLSWPAVSTNLTAGPVTGYKIWRSSTSSTSGYTNVGTTTGTSWVDNSTNDAANTPANGTTYWYVIQTYGPSGLTSSPTFSAGTPSPTSGVNFSTSVTPYGVPSTATTPFTASPGSNLVSLSWTAPATVTGANAVSGYNVFRSVYNASTCNGTTNTGCTWTRVGDSAGSGTAGTTVTWLDNAANDLVSAPVNGTTYEYKVQSYNTNWNNPTGYTDSTQSYTAVFPTGGVTPINATITYATQNLLPGSNSTALSPTVTAFSPTSYVQTGTLPTSTTFSTSTGVFTGPATASWTKNLPAATGTDQMASGDTFACDIRSGGAVWCWGDNTYGQLGTGVSGAGTESYVPVPTLITSGATDVTAGSNFACAIASGAVKCWGNNTYGQMGNGVTGGSYSTPQQVSGLTANATVLSAGTSHVCAVVSGAVKCWGRNNSSQLGNGSTTTSNVPVSPSTVTSSVTDVAAGDAFTCAIRSGAVYCWGNGGSGQMGNATTTTNTTPGAASSPINSGATALAASSASACVIISTSLYCWGSNSSGELGYTINGSKTTLSTATNGNGLSSVTAVGSYGSGFCAVSGTSVRCWGGSYGDSNSSATTRTVTGITATSTSNLSQGSQSNTLFALGGTKAWGDNTYGQLANGATSTTFATTPITPTVFYDTVSMGFPATLTVNATNGVLNPSTTFDLTSYAAPRGVYGSGVSAATTANANQSITVTWQPAYDAAPNTIAGYDIYRVAASGTCPASGYVKINNSLVDGASTGTYVDNAANSTSAPTAGSTYCYEIQSVGPTGLTGSMSAPAGSGVIAYSPPAAVTGFDATQTTSATSSISLAWTPAASTTAAPLTGYNIKRYTLATNPNAATGTCSTNPSDYPLQVYTTTTGSGSNVITNPGFEGGSTTGYSSASSITTSTNYARSGTNSERTTLSATTDSNILTWNGSTLPAAGTYQLSAWFYVTSTSTLLGQTVSLAMESGANYTLVASSPATLVANTWVQATATYIFSSTTLGAMRARISVNPNSYQSQNIYSDDWSVQSTPTSWIDNAANNPSNTPVAGNTYCYLVQSYSTVSNIDDPSNYAYQATTAGTTAITTPAVPGTPTVTQTSGANQSLTLSFTPITSTISQPSTGYNVLRATYSGSCGTFNQINSTSPLPIATGTYVDNATNSTSAPTAGTQYCYRVQAIGNAAGTSTSGTSTQVYAVTAPAAPASASVSTAAINTSQAINVSWSAVTASLTAPITGYNIYRSSTSSTAGYSLISTYSGAGSGTITWQDNPTNNVSNPPANGTTYWYIIQTANTAASLVSSPTITSGTPSPTTGTNFTGSATATGAPAAPGAAPTTLQTSGASQSITVNWTQATSTSTNPVNGYYVYRATVSGGPYTRVSNLLSGVATVQWIDNSSNDIVSAPAAGTTYYYKIQSANSTSWDNTNAVASSTTAASPGTLSVTYPTAPASLTAVATGTSTADAEVNSVKLSWPAVATPPASAPIYGYKIFRSTSATGPWTTAIYTSTSGVGTGTLTWIDNATNDVVSGAPTAGTTYYYNIASYGPTDGSLTTYTYGGQGVTNGTSTTSVVPYTYPATPASVTAVGTTQTSQSVTVGWNTVANTAAAPITGYYILRSADGTNYTKIGSVTGQATATYVDNSTNSTSAPTNGTPYTYRVQAYTPNFLVNTAASNNPSATPYGQPAVATGPLAAAATTNTSASVTLTWTAPSSTVGNPVNSVTVYRSSTSATSGYTALAGATAMAANSTTYTDATVVNGTTYWYMVLSTGNLSWTNPLTPTGTPNPSSGTNYSSSVVPVGPPTTASSTGATITGTYSSGTSQSITVTWAGATTTANPAASYTILRSTDNVNFSSVGTVSVPSSGTYYSVTNTSGTIAGTWADNATNNPGSTPVNGTTYYYKITTTGTNGQTATTGTSFPAGGVVPYGPPAAPTACASAPCAYQTTGASQSITVNWTATPQSSTNQVSGYNILRSTNATTGFTQINASLVSGQATQTYLDNATNSTSAPTAGTTYYYEIQSVGPNGQTGTNTTSVPAGGVLSVTNPAPPANFTAAATGTSLGTAASNSITVSWTAATSTTAAPIAGYRLYRSTSASGPWNGTPVYTYSGAGTGTITWVDDATNNTVSGAPVNGTTYYYNVIAYGPTPGSLTTAVYGSNSGTVAVAYTNPSTPTTVTASGTTQVSQSVDVGWTPPSTTTRTNLMTNPSFESGATGWAGNGGSDTVAQTATDAKVGTKSLLVTQSINAYSGAVASAALIPITVGQTYTESLWIKVPTGQPAATLLVGGHQTDSAGASIITQNWTPATTYTSAMGWVRASVTFTALTGAAKFRIYVMNTGNTALITAGQQFLIDGVLFEQASDTGTYFDGNTNGATWTGTANASTSTYAGGSNPIAGYYIQRSTDNVTYATIGTAYGAATASYVDNATNSTSAPTNGTTYYYQVQAFTPNFLVNTSVSNAPTATPYGQPAVATGPLAASATTNTSASVSLTWTSPSNTIAAPVDSVTVYRSTTSSTSGYTALAAGTGLASNTTSFTDTTVSNGTTYWYMVLSTGRNGWTNPLTPTGTPNPSSGTNYSSSVVPVGPPAATTGFTTKAATPNTSASISLVWTAASTSTANPVSGYYVWRSTSATSGYSNVQTVTGQGTTSWTDTTVTNGTAYYYIVQSYGTNGQTSSPAITSGTPSPTSGNNFTGAITPYGQPAATSAPTVSQTSGAVRSIKVDWAQASSTTAAPVTGYYIWRSTAAAGTYTQVGTVSGLTTLTWTDDASSDPGNTPVAGTTYYYKIQSAGITWDSTSGVSFSTASAGITAVTTPAYVTWVTATTTQNTSQSITLSWTAASSTTAAPITGYRVLRSTSATGTYTQVGSDLAGATTATYTDDTTNSGASAPANGTSYYYRIRSYYTTANLTADTVQNVVGIAYGAPAAPTNPQAAATDSASASLTVSWSTASATTKTNRATNPSFESGATTGWAGQGTGTVTASTTRAWSGTRSGVLARGAGSSTDDYVELLVSGLSSSTTYTASAWVYLPAGASAAQLYQSRALFWLVNYTGGTTTALASPDYTLTGGWQRVEVSLPTSATSTSLNIRFYAPSSNDWYIDGVQLESGSVGTPYFDGNSTYGSWSGTTNLSTSTIENGTNPVTGYYIWRSTTSGGTYTRVGTVTSPGTASWVDNSSNNPTYPLTNGTTYYYKIQSSGLTWDNNSASSFTAATTGDIPYGTPTTPAWGSVAATTGAASSVDVIWTCSTCSSTGGNAVSGFNVLRSTDNTNFSQTGSAVPFGTNNYTDTAVTAGTTYYYKIQSYGPNNLTSTLGTSKSGIPQTNPAQITTAQAVRTQSVAGSITITWTDISTNLTAANITGYNVQRAQTSTCSSGTYADVTGGTMVAPGTQTFADTTGSLGTNYCYRVQPETINGLNPTTYSSWAGPVAPVGTPPTVTLSGAAPTTNAAQSMTITWTCSTCSSTGSNPVSSFNILRSTTSGGTYSQINTSAVAVGSTSYVDNATNSNSAPANNTTYYYKVQSVGPTLSVTTIGNVSGTTNAVPTTPTWGTLTGGNGRIVLNWSSSAPNTTITSYTVTYVSGGTGTACTTTGSPAASTCTITTSLVTGTSYTFSMTATNVVGTSGTSATSSAVIPISISGGTSTCDSTYCYRTFAGTAGSATAGAAASITVTGNSLSSVDILAIAGGGGGGYSGGGGGAGGTLALTAQTLANGTAYTCTPGGGSPGGASAGARGTNGTNTTFIGGAISLTATGGGGGGAGATNTTGAAGGSAGGHGAATSTATAASPASQGYAGGIGKSSTVSGGGGGASGVGGSASGSTSGGSGPGFDPTAGGATYAAGTWGTTSQNWSYGGAGQGGSNTTSSYGGGGRGNTGAGTTGIAGMCVVRYPAAVGA